MPLPSARRIAGHVAPGGLAAERREQDGGHRDAEHPLREHVDPERVVDRPRRLAETSVPNTELSSWSRLTIPSPIVTGSISVNTCRTRGSRQSTENCRRKSIRRRAEATSSSCTTVATSQAIA